MRIDCGIVWVKITILFTTFIGIIPVLIRLHFVCADNGLEFRARWVFPEPTSTNSGIPFSKLKSFEDSSSR